MRYHDRSLCPACEIGELKRLQGAREFSYKGTKTNISCTSYECQKCGEFFFEENEKRHIERALTDVRRRIDGLLTSDEIRAIRKSFDRTQTEFAKLLRVGEKNFARYESGQTTQSRSMNNLLRVLQVLPEAIGIFEKGEAGEKRREVYAERVAIRRMKRSHPAIRYESLGQELDMEGVFDHASSF